MQSHTHRFRVARTSTATANLINSTSAEHYLHTGARIQACTRCRLLKKRCSKTLPTCELCMSGGHTCSLGHLADRQNAPQTTPNAAQDTVVGSVDPALLQEESGVQLPSPRTLEHRAHNAAATASTFDGTYLSYVHAYFRHVHRAYPFLDRQEILSNAKASAYLNVWADNPDSIILGLVLSIGSTTLERAGKLSVYDRPHMVVPYTRILSGCLSSPSLKGLQILTLLSLYSLFDPKGVSTWSVVGILTRQALTLGLSRENSSLRNSTPQEQELEHRLFWSIFVLDRMLAASVGHPAGLVDENMNIPQPAMTVEEFASSERAEHASLLQLNRHIIQLRQLEHRILTSIHTRSRIDISYLGTADRGTISSQLRSAIDDWYSLGCLVCLPDADNIPIHSTITWLNARYYNLLILLYYPCHFNSQSTHDAITELVGYIRKYFKYNHVLLGNRQLPLNSITLNRMIPACLVLIYCFNALRPLDFSAKLELSNCIEILRAFPQEWQSAYRTTEVATEFLSIVTSHEAYAAACPTNCIGTETISFNSSTRRDLQKVINDLTGIAAKSLGPTSCYLSLCDWQESELVSIQPADASETDTESMTEHLSGWAPASFYDFGFV